MGAGAAAVDADGLVADAKTSGQESVMRERKPRKKLKPVALPDRIQPLRRPVLRLPVKP